MEAFEGAENKLKKLLKENPNVYDAWERVAKADVEGLKLKYKKFPEKEGNYVLEQAKKYQAKFSGDANLSFEHNGVSFDDFKDGVLVDAKYGHGNSVFNKISDAEWEDLDIGDLIKNEQRATSLVNQARRQIGAIQGTALKIEWHISTELGAKGIEKLLQSRNMFDITVKFIAK